eukprot:jgi/Botrbrau1/9896/Bobra.0080s0025.1
MGNGQALEAAYGGGEHASEGGVASEAENATAAYAAHFILSSYFPWRQYVFDALIKKQVGNYSADVKRGASALAIPWQHPSLGLGRMTTAKRWSPFHAGPSERSPRCLAVHAQQTYALYPQLANTTTFVTPAPGKFANTLVGAAKPLAVGTSEYAKELADVASVGEKSSGDRSQYESETATFWAQPAGTSQLAAWLGAGVAAYDGNINAWFLKYSVLFWRPITAIRQGSEGINAQPNWTPFLATPPHPEYPSTHAVTCSAYFRTFQRFLGTDDVKLTLTSDAAGLAPRTYSKLSDAGKECAQSSCKPEFAVKEWDGRAAGSSAVEKIAEGQCASRDIRLTLNGQEMKLVSLVVVMNVTILREVNWGSGEAEDAGSASPAGLFLGLQALSASWAVSNVITDWNAALANSG